MQGEFFCEEIEVDCEGTPKRPVAFTWRGTIYPIEEILASWHDWGFASTAPKKDWRSRRHRNHYHVRTTSGEAFDIYFDRGSARAVWILLKKLL